MNACKSGDKYKEGVAMGTIGTTAAACAGLTRARNDKGLNPMPAANT